MSEPQDATTEWTDTDSSELEAETVTFYHKTDLKRKQSLVLTALGLSQADSHQRKRYRSDLPSQRNLFSLPREIRNQIYNHLTFLPTIDTYKDDEEDSYSARNLAQTCRQAKAECDEEFALRLWKYLKHVEALHLSETGYQLTFSNLVSSHDLLGVKSLKAIIRGPFPDPWTDELVPLLKLPVHELTIRYTGRYGSYDIPPQLYESSYNIPREVRQIPNAIFTPFCFRIKRGIGPRLITVSWNRQEEKRDTTLIERTFETSHLDPKDAKSCCVNFAKWNFKERLPEEPIGVNVTWASLKFALSENMEVGYCKFNRGSNVSAVIQAQEALTYTFCWAQSGAYDLNDVGSMCCIYEGRAKVTGYKTEIKYKVSEDE